MKFLLFLLTLNLFIPHVSANTFRQSVSNQEMFKHGREVYESRCIGCHGEKGDGKGGAAVFLDPKPRDFTSGVFKFKSTPNESLPSDEDLMRVLSHGVLGTSMPSFKLLPEVSKYAVIHYIKSFSKAWNDKENFMAQIQGAPFPLEDFRSPEPFIARAQKGRKVYIENCLICHGRKGKGDGEGGVDLTDDWDHPIVPADLTKTYIKSGRSVRDIYRVLLTGMAGTPMPAFKEAISDNDLWDVSAYVLYLRGLNNDSYDQANPPIKEITEKEAEDQ